jgi:L-amino acid N-acyltransferase YncA
MLTIDDANRHDLPEILAIYNEVIRNSTAVYTEVELTQERGHAWFNAKVGNGFPIGAAGALAGRCSIWCCSCNVSFRLQRPRRLHRQRQRWRQTRRFVEEYGGRPLLASQS